MKNSSKGFLCGGEDFSSDSPIMIIASHDDRTGSMGGFEKPECARCNIEQGDPKWNELADIDKNETVNILDVTMGGL